MKMFDKIKDFFKLNCVAIEHSHVSKKVGRLNQILHDMDTDMVLLPFRKAEKYGYINLRGEVVIPPKYDHALEFKNGLARIELNGKFGYINQHSEIIINPMFELGLSYGCGCIPVKAQDKWGVIDKQGNFVISPRYDDIESSGFVNDVCIVSVNEKLGIITTDGTYLVPPRYQDLSYAGNGLWSFQENGRYGYMDLKGRIVVEPIYQYAFPFRSNIALVETLTQERAFIDTKGNLLFNRFFSDAYSFSEGIACVKINNHFSFINEQGNEVLSVKMDSVTNFTEEKAPILRGGKWGFINRSGEIIIPCEYDDVNTFEFGMASVFNIQREQAVITPENRTILPFFDYYGVIINKYGLIEVEHNGEYGYMTSEGEWLYKPSGIP